MFDLKDTIPDASNLKNLLDGLEGYLERPIDPIYRDFIISAMFATCGLQIRNLILYISDYLLYNVCDNIYDFRQILVKGYYKLSEDLLV